MEILVIYAGAFMLKIAHRIFTTDSYEKWCLLFNDKECGFIDCLSGETANHVYLILTKEVEMSFDALKEFALTFPEFLGSNKQVTASIFLGSETELIVEE